MADVILELDILNKNIDNTFDTVLRARKKIDEFLDLTSKIDTEGFKKFDDYYPDESMYAMIRLILSQKLSFDDFVQNVTFSVTNDLGDTYSGTWRQLIDIYEDRNGPGGIRTNPGARPANARGGIIPKYDIIELWGGIASYSLETTQKIDFPLTRLIKQSYMFNDFDRIVTERVRGFLLEAKTTTISLLRMPGPGSVEQTIANQNNINSGPNNVAFPASSFAEDIKNPVFVDKFLGNSLASGNFELDPNDVSDSWFDSVISFLLNDKLPTKSIRSKMEEDYSLFIQAVIEDSIDIAINDNQSTLLDKLQSTVQQSVDNPMTLDEDKINLSTSGLYSLIARYFENTRRQAFYDQEQIELTDEEIAAGVTAQDKIEQQVTQELSDAPAGADVEEPELTEEDIKNRQRFFKQCALMMNLPILSEAFTDIIKQRVETKINNRQNFTGPVNNTCGVLTEQFNNMPFDGRLFMVSNPQDQSATLSKMLNSNVAKELFNIPPAVLSSLVPKIKLYRVENTDEGIKKTEFVFDSSEDLNRQRNFMKATNFLDMPFDKGSGVGLKDFSFEFNGTNPAESRKDIKASLTLHFQSFDDFVADRKSYNNEKYAFVDLIIHSDEVDNVLLHPDQYNPSFYRIMAEVGYHIPSKEELQAMFPWYQNVENLVEALKRTNKAFYLCMIDHDFNINVDGTVNLTVSYGAYVETILKTHQYDALATPDVVAQRKVNTKQYLDALKSNQCTQDQLQRILAALDAQEAALREKSLKSIIQRLVERNKIFVCEISTAQASSYRRFGFFKKKPELKGLVSKSKEVTQDDVVKQGQETGVTETILTQVYLPEDYNFNSPHDNTIQYFYFGDLLHTVLDTMYEDGSPSKLREEVENCRFILGSFDFDVYKDAGNLDHTVNIAQIPISVEYFADWFQDNVLKKGDTRKSFPIVTFIRNLSSKLLQQSLLESCINRRIDKNFSFQTGQITAYNKAGNPLRSIFGEQNVEPIINIDEHRPTESVGVFPFAGDTTSEVKDISGYHNFMYLGVLGSSLTTDGSGKYATDNSNGIYHIEIGNNKGIVKSVSFAKTDMQFVREARFFQQGIDGLLQLSTVYKVTIEMFGNTIFYPGMDLFLNPYGIGGDKLGSPTQGGLVAGQKRSLANKLGIGGYHTVTSVRSSIGVNGFKTTIEAQMYYAGDGSKIKLGSNPNKRMQKISQTNAPSKTNNNNSCKAIVERVESDLDRIESSLRTFGISSISNVNQTANNVQNNATNSTPASPLLPVDPNDIDGDGLPNAIDPEPTVPFDPASGTQAAAQAAVVQTQAASTGQGASSGAAAINQFNQSQNPSAPPAPPAAPTTTPETPTTPPASGTQPTEAPAEAAAAEETPAETPEPEAAAEENLQVTISDEEQAEAAVFDEYFPLYQDLIPKEVSAQNAFEELNRLDKLYDTTGVARVPGPALLDEVENGVEFQRLIMSFTDGRPRINVRKRK